VAPLSFQAVVTLSGEHVEVLLAVRMIVEGVLLSRQNADEPEGHRRVRILFRIAEPGDRAPRELQRRLGRRVDDRCTVSSAHPSTSLDRLRRTLHPPEVGFPA